MIKLTLNEIVQAMGGRPWGDLPPVSVGGVSTDSRSAAPDELFFALRGPRFDGHDFVADALRRGTVAAVVASDQAERVAQMLRNTEVKLPRGAVLIEVPDTIAALGRLAAYHRENAAADVIAVVGSNGKTTTKAMIHHVLAGKLRGRCSPKSFNNNIGVPLTLLSVQPSDEYVVVEIGTNAPGEIAALAALVRPDMVVLTSVGEEHLEGLGSLEGVAEEECAILGHLRPKGFAAINIDQPVVLPHLKREGLSLATFGRSADADVRLTDVRYEPPWLVFKVNNRFPFRLRLAGEHNAVNASGAVTIARRLGFDYGEAAVRLESFVLPPMRNEIVEWGGVTVVNDAYNANPQSAVAALDTLEQLPCRGRRIVVFGEMRELGAHSADLHRKVAQRLRDGNFERVILVGEGTGPMVAAMAGGELFGPAVEHVATVADCQERLLADVRAGDVVLLKASRAVELERLMEPLRQHLAGANG